MLDINLINQELNNFTFIEKEQTYSKIPSDNLISNLENKYICSEFCELYYDSEPLYDEETFKMYMDYNDHILDMKKAGREHPVDPYREYRKGYASSMNSLFNLKRAHDEIKKQIAEYEPKRLKFNNWVEPYFEGNWNYTQKQVDSIAIEMLKKLKKSNTSKNQRFWIYKNDRIIFIYFYGRDLDEMADYSWIFEKRGENEETKKVRDVKKEEKVLQNIGKFD